MPLLLLFIIKMKKTIDGMLYNTATATLLVTYKNSSNIHYHYYIKECLYKTTDGVYFIYWYWNGGTSYDGTADIVVMSSNHLLWWFLENEGELSNKGRHKVLIELERCANM